VTAQPEEAVGQEAAGETASDVAPMRAEARGRASSIPTAFPLPLDPETGTGARWSPEVVRAWLLGRVEAVKARELDLIHGPPTSVAAMHERHRVAASHWRSPLLRGARSAYGALHTAIYAQLLALGDATFSPAGLILSALLVYLLVYWL
jgi:hypothetical protein